MLTIGAPHSSTAPQHSSTLSFSLIVVSYSRIRPHPVQVRLQACSGSSIRTSGNFLVPVIFFLAMYPAMVVVRLSGNRISGASHGRFSIGCVITIGCRRALVMRGRKRQDALVADRRGITGQGH